MNDYRYTYPPQGVAPQERRDRYDDLYGARRFRYGAFEPRRAFFSGTQNASRTATHIIEANAQDASDDEIIGVRDLRVVLAVSGTTSSTTASFAFAIVKLRGVVTPDDPGIGDLLAGPSDLRVKHAYTVYRHRIVPVVGTHKSELLTSVKRIAVRPNEVAYMLWGTTTTSGSVLYSGTASYQVAQVFHGDP